jgi:hypothetical protein
VSASLITATYCAQDSDFHAASVLALVAGLIMAADGIVRRIVSARTAAAYPFAPAGPAGPWQAPTVGWPPPPQDPQGPQGPQPRPCSVPLSAA